MSSLKCPQCGLVNFATAPACKRCKLPFTQQEADSYNAPSQADQGYYQSVPQGQQPYNLNYPQGVWRDGSLMVMTKETVLPNRCVKCNEPATKLLKRTVEWYPRYVILVFILIRIAGLILYFCLRKRVTIHIGLCESHINRRNFGVLTGLLMLLLGTMAFFGAFTSEVYQWVFPGLLLIFGGIIVMTVMWRVVTANKIEGQYVWVKGINKDFLAALPPV